MFSLFGFGKVPSRCGHCPVKKFYDLGIQDAPMLHLCGHKWSADHEGNMAFVEPTEEPPPFCPKRIEQKMGFWGFLKHRIMVFFGRERAVRSLLERKDAEKSVESEKPTSNDSSGKDSKKK
jgi:hypothetical protein